MFPSARRLIIARPAFSGGSSSKFSSARNNSTPLLNNATIKTSSFIKPTITQTTTLSNGMRVASEDLEGETATIGIWIDGGSRYEGADNNGVAHFMEHMSFKGTPNRTQSGLELEIENMGGHLNAYTSREQTAFYAKVFKKDIPKAVEILADILLNPSLDHQYIERERDVILREQEEVDKQMEEVVFDHLHATAYQGTALGRTILGTEKNIRTISKKDLQSYIKETYIAPRMVMAAAGGVDHQELVRLTERAFKGIPSGRSTHWKAPPSKYTGSEVRLFDDTMPLAHMVLSVQGASWTSPDYFPLLIAQSMMGSWNRGLAGGHNLGSKLAQVIAKNNLANSYVSFNTSYNDTGLFGVYMVSDHLGDLDDLCHAVQQEWCRICMNASEGEVARAKTQLKTEMLLSLDGSTPICEDIGRQMLCYGKRYNWQQVHEMIDAVDAASVRKVASQYLYDQDPAVVAMGPISTFPDYNRIRTGTRWLRS